MSIFIRLYLEFFFVGLFSVGGGLATVPFLSDLGLRTAWFSAADLINMIAISESTPGPIGINMATYVGFTTAGPLGAIIAPLGLSTPAFFIILLISKLLQKFSQNKNVIGFFYGLRPASLGLIGAVCFGVCSASLFSKIGVSWVAIWPCIAIFVVVFLCLNLPKVKRLHPVIFLLLSAIAGIVFQL
ncbi:MAG: chromate transporter [Evtepia sp.]